MKSLRTPLICLLLAGLTLAVFWPVRQCAFLNWDDTHYVVDNDHVRGGLTWSGVRWAFGQCYSGNWHPLTWLSHMLDCQLYGLNSGPQHLTNAVFHALNSVLLFLLLRALTSAIWRSALVAALFALHPLHVESVAWLAERKDVLSTFFFMLTLAAYVRYAEARRRNSEGRTPKAERRPNSEGRSPNAESPGQTSSGIQLPVSSIQHPVSNIQTSSFILHPSSFWYWLAVLLFAFGLMSKPMLVTLPFVLLLLDYWPLRRLHPSTLNPQPSTFLPLLLEKLPFLALSAASCVITLIAQKQGGAMLSLEVMPLDARIENAAVACAQYLLKFFWPVNLSPVYPLPLRWDPLQIGGAVALLALLSAATWRWRARFPFGLVGWAWFLGTLVPVLGIVQVGGQAFADRYTYIPLIGIMLAVVWLAGVWLQSLVGPPRRGGRSAALSAKAPYPTEALRAGEEIRVYPCPSVVNLVFAVVLPVLVLGVLGWRSREQLAIWKDTETVFGRALELAPDSGHALNGLGGYLITRGRVEEGKRLLERLVQLDPAHSSEPLVTLGDALDDQHRYLEAVECYQAALKAQPDHARALNNFARLRVTCADPAFRDSAEAVRLATRACELTGYSQPLVLGTLAAAQAEAGDLAAAIATTERQTARLEALGLVAEARQARDAAERLKFALGSTLQAKGRAAEALPYLEAAAQREPSSPQAHFELAEALSQLGRPREAIAHYNKALELQPEHLAALNNLAWLLATDPDDASRNGARAVQLAERACKLTAWNQPYFMGTLAAAYAEAGRFADAVAMAERARDKAKAAGLKGVAEKNEQLMERYRAKQPYRSNEK